MEHHRYRIHQRKNRKGEKGIWYYRKRIPADVLGVWISKGRSLKEYSVSLATLDKREAEKRAIQEHKTFLSILEMKRQKSRVWKSESLQRIQEHQRYETSLRRLGAHPEQAPRVTAPLEDITKYQDAVDKVRYGSLVESEHHEALQTFAGGLSDYQIEVGLDPSFDRQGNETFIPNERYYEIQKDIEFLSGKRVNGYALKTDIPSLSDALTVYSSKVIGTKEHLSERDRQNQVLRAKRVVERLAFQLGAGDKDHGMGRQLNTIMNQDAELFIQTLRTRDDGKGSKAWASVKREITLIKAIWNNAFKVYSETWPQDQRRENPFKVISLPTLQSKHESEVASGEMLDKTRRPFTPEELVTFLKTYTPRMGIELQLITVIAEHAGCRIGDATGLVLGDCLLKTSEARPIPSLKIVSNHIRKVTKGGIEREIPLFGSLYDRLVAYTDGRTGPDTPLFPTYGHSQGAGNASAAINKHIKGLRGDDVRLTFHSFRHTLQSKALAATDMPNKFPAYIGGWQNGDAKGLQAEYQKGGIPLKVLKEALQTIHAVEDWGRFLNDPHHDEWN